MIKISAANSASVRKQQRHLSVLITRSAIVSAISEGTSDAVEERGNRMLERRIRGISRPEHRGGRLHREEET